MIRWIEKEKHDETCHTYRDQGERCWLGQDTKHCKHSPMHPHSCNQTSNLLTCTRPSLLSGNCSPASCPRGKWPCRAALSNAPIYREPKEHLSASSPCQPLSIAVGWPETPSPSRTPHHAPHTRPTVCRASTDCVSMLGHPVGKACQRLIQTTRKKPFAIFHTWSCARLPQQ